jgi:transposase
MMAKQYSKEFREEAARLVLEGNVSTTQAAKDLGMSVWTLRGWVKKHREKSGEGSVRGPESLEQENRRLRRENAVLKQEREILKKAAAYFAKEQL